MYCMPVQNDALSASLELAISKNYRPIHLQKVVIKYHLGTGSSASWWSMWYLNERLRCMVDVFADAEGPGKTHDSLNSSFE